MGEMIRAARKLASEGFAFMLPSNDCKITLMKGDETIDFWPTTDMWWIRGSKSKRRGIDNLIKFLKKETK